MHLRRRIKIGLWCTTIFAFVAAFFATAADASAAHESATAAHAKALAAVPRNLVFILWFPSCCIVVCCGRDGARPSQDGFVVETSSPAAVTSSTPRRALPSRRSCR